MSNYDYKLNFIIIGDTNSGKTSLVRHYSIPNYSYRFYYEPTIGVDFSSKIIKKDSTFYKLHIWDTSGQERFRSITKSYYRDVLGIILCINLTEKKSIRNLNEWFKNIEENAPKEHSVVLVGTYNDKKKNDFCYEQLKQISIEKNIPYCVVSTKEKSDISKPFDILIDKIYNKINNNEINLENIINNKEKHSIIDKKEDMNCFCSGKDDLCCYII